MDLQGRNIGSTCPIWPDNEISMTKTCATESHSESKMANNMDAMGTMNHGMVDSFKMVSLEKVKEIGELLAFDNVYHISGFKKCKPVNKYAVTLRRTVTEVSEKHAIVFNSMVKKLGPLTQETLPQVFLNVVEEMFRDCQYNWGRVVSVFAFASVLARHFHQKGHDDMVEETAEFLGKYVANQLGPWIAQQGGWVSIISLNL